MDHNSRFGTSLFVLVALCIFPVIYSNSPDTPVYVTNGSHILRFDRDTKNVDIIYSEESARIVGLAVDINKGMLFWSDIATSHQGIYRSNLDGSQPELVVEDVEECNGLSVDWISNHIYWTDARQHTLEIANYDGSGRRILVGSDLQDPRGIVVDPVLGYLFWADQGTKRVERSWLDGSHRKAIVQHGVFWPNQLAVSLVFRKLYWVDTKDGVIMSCDINGDNMEVERDLTNMTGGNPSFGLTVVGNTAIISTWFSTALYSMLVETKLAIWREEISNLGTTELFSLLVIDPSLQPLGDHPCGFPDRGGCSHLCLPSRGTAYRCSCPSYGGLALAQKGKKCQDPQELLFFTFMNSGEVGFVSLDGAPTSDVTLVARSAHPSAVTYDPIDKVVYWSDVFDSTIYSANVDGSDRQVFLNSSHGVGIVDGMTLDWVDRRLYFTNMGQSSPFLDGAVYTWHRIEMIDLDGSSRRTVITDVEKPRGLTLDLQNGYLYYGDWGESPKVVRTLLDGTHPTVLLQSQLSNPNGIAVARGTVYVADSNYNNRTEMAEVFIYHTANNTGERLVIEEKVKMPMGLTIAQETLYYTDWVSMTADEGKIMSVDLAAMENGGEILIGRRPTGLHYSPLLRISDPMERSCDSLVCSQKCIRTHNPEYSPYRCMCPDQSSLILSSDSATCARPENFLLFADLNTLKMLSLDPNTEETVHTLHYGESGANYVALVYDDGTDTIYWSDQNRKAILSSPLNKISPSVVYEGDYFIDGLVIDSERQRIFWTAAAGINGTGHIAKINLQRGLISYSQIVTRLNNPRAVTLCSEKKWIFWTEHQWSKTSASIYRAKVNGHQHKVLLSRNLYWPNSLIIQGNRLYVADGVGKVLSMDLDGSNMEELRFLTGSVDHIFGMAIHGSALIYSDWYTNSIQLINLVTGNQEAMASNLSRPTAVVLYHPTNLTEESLCQTEQNSCSHSCIPLPRRLHCSCPVGYKLGPDGSACQKLESPWEMVEVFYCPWSCHEHAQCAHLVPLLKFQCVCNSGYHGDGRYCSVCPEDTYKRYLGNDSCLSCGEKESTSGAVASTYCQGMEIFSEVVPVTDIVSVRELESQNTESTQVHVAFSNVTESVSEDRVITTSASTMDYGHVNKSISNSDKSSTSPEPVDKTNNRVTILQGTGMPTKVSHTYEYPNTSPSSTKIKTTFLNPVDKPTSHITEVSTAYTNTDRWTMTVPNLASTQKPMTDSSSTSTQSLVTDHLFTIPPAGDQDEVFVWEKIDRPDKPYFENCPDELVILPLPLPKAEINLPVELIAWDQDHNKLPVKCNYPIKGNTIGLRQEDLIENTNLQIIAEAEDKWGQRVICDFIVMVQDIPREPYFEDCPDDALTLPLPLPKDDVDIPIMWTARDHLHNKLSIKSNYQVEGNNIRLQREELMMDTKPHVVLEAQDERGRRVVCDFNVKVQEGPYFEDCPKELITLHLPPSKNKVDLPIVWKAWDRHQKQLSIKSNYVVQDYVISLWWIDLMDDIHHQIKLEAEDEWGNEVLCEFSVRVKDEQPPIFTYCPHDLVIKTSQVSERVLWPRPEATDNVGLRSLIGSQKPGSEFLRGTTLLSYTALDKAGNTAMCNFSVTIVEEKQCSLPAINNGAFVCGRDSDELETCYVVCESNFFINPVSTFTQGFNCKIRGDMLRLTKLMETQEPCLFKRIPSTARQEFRMSFTGPCNDSNTALVSELSTRVISYLETKNICPTARCEFGNISVHCGKSVNSGPVEKRSPEHRFDVKWNITIENSTGFSRGQVEAILINIRLELMKLVSRLYISVNGEHYSALPGSVTVARVTWVCHDGEMVHDNGCLECPPGSYINMTTTKCQLCVRGTYQPLGGQSSCEPCLEGHTPREGAVESAQCVSLPSIDEMSKFLIITACTFGFVFLCMAIFMYLQYQRQQRHIQQSLALARSNRYITPNIYVAPPPIPKPKLTSDFKLDRSRGHVYNNHDYEDIDGSITLSTQTLYQNDFHNFSPSLRSKRSPKPTRYYMYDQ